jgi:DNA-binding MarR family transcriptional regulator
MGHLHRVRNRTDRRRVVLEITEQARHESEGAFRPLGVKFQQLLQGYSEEELAVLDRFLGDLRESIRDYGGEVLRRHG